MSYRKCYGDKKKKQLIHSGWGHSECKLEMKVELVGEEGFTLRGVTWTWSGSNGGCRCVDACAYVCRWVGMCVCHKREVRTARRKTCHCTQRSRRWHNRLPWWLRGKEPACQRKSCELDPWVQKTPWRGKWHPLQHSCLENPMDRGAWQAAVHGPTKESDVT